MYLDAFGILTGTSKFLTQVRIKDIHCSRVKPFSILYSIIFAFKQERVQQNRQSSSEGTGGKPTVFSFQIHGKQFYLITQLSQPAFFSCLKRTRELDELTKWWDEWFICSASCFIGMASPWHSGQRYKTYCSTQVLNDFFPLERFPPFPHPLCALQNCHFKQLLALCLCSVSVDGSNSSLQKASSAHLSHLNYFHHPTLYLRI